MNTRFSNLSPLWFWGVGSLLLVAVLWLTSAWWLPTVQQTVAHSTTGGDSTAPAEDPHAGHDHAAHAGHDQASSLELSPQARKNIGLETGEIALSSFSRSITVPALVTGRPGQTTFHISAPLTGVVTGVNVVRGEAVNSGKLLFNLRLTHEDLVKTQTEFLQLLGQLDVEHKELQRVESIGSGAIAGKVILERQYEVDKLEARLKAQEAALQLHGLTKEQVSTIYQTRNLLRQIEVHAPFLHNDDSLHNDSESHEQPRRPASREQNNGDDTPLDKVSFDTQAPHNLNMRQFVVRSLDVENGEAVKAGQTLCVLVDYNQLYIEGRAFEHDAGQLVKAANQGRTVTAVPEAAASEGQPIEGLNIVYVSNEVDMDSRALHFYVELPNRVVREETNQQGRHYLTWKHKPGQRMQVRVPVETWDDVIVVPVDAIAEEGPETFLFVENGNHFDRRPVHVMYRDQFEAVVDNDGAVFPGDTVALTSAHQLQMALKNKAGGAVDPHAGHNH